MGSAILSIGVRSMAAAYAQMQTTSHNIANANTEGYTRQRTLLATAPGQFTGQGFFGRGVNVTCVERTTDSFMVREAVMSKSVAAMDAARLERMRQLESVFKTGEQGIGHSISQLFSAMSDLASRPADTATRQVVLSRAQDLALRFNDAGQGISTIQRNLKEDAGASVDAINSLAQSIAQANQEIALQSGTGQTPNDLIDERDRLISKLSAHVQVTTLTAEDGSVGVFMGGGQRLVLGTQAERLSLQPDPYDASRVAVAISEGAKQRLLTTDALSGGRIAGTLAFQNGPLVTAQAQLGQLALALAGAVNDQQQLGINLRPPAGSVPSQPLFGFLDSTGPMVMPADTNAPGASDVSIEIVDASQLQATEYDLREDPHNAGNWLLRRVPDDGKPGIAVTDGSEVDGFVIHFNNGPASGDRFRLQPASRAAVGMQRLLSDPLDLAAASPFVGSTPPTNAGSARIDALRMREAPADVQATATITFTGVAPGSTPGMSYTWQVLDNGGVPIGTGTGTWTPGQPLPAPPAAPINGFELDLSGTPAVGDTLSVVPNAYPTQNNGNALALTRLGALSQVGLAALAGGGTTGGATFNDAFAAAVADVGVRTQGAQAAADISAARASQAEAARASRAGVNLDEEAARLIQFQQAYQASAKVLQIAQSLFDDLLRLAG